MTYMTESARREAKLAMCHGKQQHDRATANRIVRETRKVKLEAFKCRWCGKWHVGNPVGRRHP